MFLRRDAYKMSMQTEFQPCLVTKTIGPNQMDNVFLENKWSIC